MGKRRVNLLLNGRHKLRFRLDCGSEASVIGPEQKDLIFLQCKQSSNGDRKHMPKVYLPDCVLLTANKTAIDLVGYMKVQFSIDNCPNNCRTHQENLYISRKKIAEPLLSEQACVQLGLISYASEVFEIRREKKPEKTIPESERYRFDNLKDDQIRRILEIEDKFPIIFTRPGLYLDGKYQAKIQIDKTCPKYLSKVRPLPVHYREKVKAEIDRMLREKKIERTTPGMKNLWQSPMHVVKKDNDRIRIVIDSTKLKPYQIRTASMEPIRIENFIEIFRGQSFFGSCDFKQMFNQIAITPESREFTNFTTICGCFRFLVLPFGFVVSGDESDHVIHKVFEQCPFCAINRDDVCWTSSNFDQFIERLERILYLIFINGLAISKNKLRYGTSARFYGYVFDRYGYSPLPARIKSISSAIPPMEKNGLVSFLSLLNFDARFIANLAYKASILRDMTTQKTGTAKLNWTPSQLQVFHQLKNELTSATKNAHFRPDFDLMLFVDFGPSQFQIIQNEKCDNEKEGRKSDVSVIRSKAAYGAVLLQRCPKTGKIELVHCQSKRVPNGQQFLSQIAGESKALRFGLRAFEFYYRGASKTLNVFTDNKALCQIYNKPLSDKTPPQIIHDVLMTQHIDFKVQHVSSNKNISDYLSRMNLSTPNDDEIDFDEIESGGGLRMIVCNNIDGLDTSLSESLRDETDKDEELICLKQRIELDDFDQNRKNPYVKNYYSSRHQLHVVDGLVYFNQQIILPRKLRKRCLRAVHEFAHQSFEKSIEFAKNSFYFPAMYGLMREIIDTCQICQQTNMNMRHEPTTSMYYCANPLDEIHIDFKNLSWGCPNYLCIQDSYSRFLWAFPMRRTTFADVEQVLLRFFSEVGVPIRIRSDSGSPMNSKAWTEFMKKFNIMSDRSIPYKPSTDGLIESSMRTIARGVAVARAKKLSNHEDSVRCAVWARNSVKTKLLGRSPYEMFFNRKPRLSNVLPDTIAITAERLRQVESNRHRSHVIQKQYERNELANQVRDNRTHDFAVGDKVLAKVLPNGNFDRLSTIQEVNGAEITARDDETGATFKRHSTFFRRHLIDNSARLPQYDPDVPDRSIPVSIEEGLDSTDFSKTMENGLNTSYDDDYERKGHENSGNESQTKFESSSAQRENVQDRNLLFPTPVTQQEIETENRPLTNGSRRVTRSMGIPVPDVPLPRTAIESSAHVRDEMRRLHEL